MTRVSPAGAAVSRLRRAVGFVLFALVLAPALLTAQASCITTPTTTPSIVWSPPLDRPVTIEAFRISVREAFERIEQESGVRFSYSSESIDADRYICLALRQVPLGAVIGELLGGFDIEPVVAGADHVVLAPQYRREQVAERSLSTEVIPLEPVVVTGNALAPEMPVPYARNVIEGSKLELRRSDDLPAILSGVPGMWAWASSPADLNVRYASIRGASSFGTTYPKIYLDGIEVANPLVLSQLIPEAIERIEVIRGPQGAALHGSDAISGVIHIRTRQHDGDPAAPRLQLRTGTGLVSSDYARDNVVSQDYVLTARAGTPERSARLSFATGSTGEYVPGAGSRYFAADGSGRLIGSDHIITGTARFNFARAAMGDSPLLGDLSGAPGSVIARQARDGAASRNSSAQYTLGGSIVYSPSARLSHTLVVGVDGYRLASRLEPGIRRLLSDSDAAGDSPVGGDRFSFRASTQWRAIDSADLKASLGFGFEQSMLREYTWLDGIYPGDFGPSTRLSNTESTSGFLTRLDASLLDVLHLSAGMRIEANDDFGPDWGFQKLPLLGATFAQEHGELTVRLRAAYGKAVRPARAALREAYGPGVQLSAAATGLQPEKQAGIEAGVDLELANLVSFSLTRFDQRAENLVQAVSFTASPSHRLAWNSEATYSLFNVGEITNRGWEAEATATLGRASLTANFTTVDSRVQRLADGYLGDLRVGDRMLEVPARTAGLTGTWADQRWSLSVNAYRAWNWINYDRERMLADFGSAPDALDAWRLRDYWRKYDGVPRLDANADVRLRPGLSLLLSAENLFDRQRGEPDNITIVPGRTLSLGVRARF